MGGGGRGEGQLAATRARLSLSHTLPHIDAVKNAKRLQTTVGIYQARIILCDHYVGVWYGYSASGWPSAIDQWNGNRLPPLHFCNILQPPRAALASRLSRNACACAGTPADKKLGGWAPGALAFYGGGSCVTARP